jgi:hypothetical protein
MKLKQKIISAMIIASLTTVALAKNKKDIDVTIESDGTNIVKIVKLDGKVLDADEIAELESSGELHLLHADGKSNEGVRHEVKVFVDKNDNETTTESIWVNGKELTYKEIEKMKDNGHFKVLHLDDSQLSDINNNIQIMVEVDGDNTTKKVIMNGKNLTDEEIEELEASGELKSFDLDVSNLDISNLDGHSFQKFMVLDPDGKGEKNHEVKLISRSIHIDDDNATLGFMTNIKKDGWHVVSVVDGSGADEAGLKSGDIIKFMGDKDLTSLNKDDSSKNLNITKREEGEMVDMEVERDGKLIYFSVEARKNNSYDMVIDIEGAHKDFSWVDKLKNVDKMFDGKNMKVVIMDGDLNKTIDFSSVDIDLPDVIGNMNMFITDGNSTSKLLGKNHEMSSLSPGLASYFGTKGGVLLMHAGTNNVFGLEDGDVIKNISGVEVNSPKEVIKQLLKSDNQEDLELKIVRHKRNKTLKFNK